MVFSGPGIRLIYRAGFGIRDLTATQEAILYSFLLGSKGAREQGSKGGAVVRVLSSNQGGLGPESRVDLDAICGLSTFLFALSVEWFNYKFFT